MAVYKDTKGVGITAPRQFDRRFITNFQPADSLDYAERRRLAGFMRCPATPQEPMVCLTGSQ